MTMAEEEPRLFEVPKEWEEHWTDMPEFVQEEDRRPHASIRVYFANEEDQKAFFERVGAPIRTRGIWFPYRPPRKYERPEGPVEVPSGRYPIYVISKGRWEKRPTSRALEALGIDYRIVIEPQERDEYAAVIDEEKILRLPFSNLGQGSIPARNWVWDHAVAEGHKKHWIVDDNIYDFGRLNRNENRKIHDENPFIPMEEFADRYRNVALAGPQYRFFASDKDPNAKPFKLNTRVYSCILINHELPFRWRGRYNEDTDLSLRALKANWCTVLFNAYLIMKAPTLEMKGGNTDELYAGDGRLKMAESLKEQHPDVTMVAERWGRAQHYVDYSPFRFNRLIPVGEAEGQTQLEDSNLKNVQGL